jgi:hypothetical protein
MAILVQRPPLASGRKALHRPWPQVRLDPLHRAGQTVKPIIGGVFQECLVMSRDLDPMLSKHFHMLGLKSQLELSGDVVMQQFASPSHHERMLGVGFQFREKTAS